MKTTNHQINNPPIETIHLSNEYALLALLLSPTLNANKLIQIHNAIDKEQIIWINILQVSSTERCTPLLYVRLHQHHLFSKLPTAVQSIITKAYQNNLARNNTLKAGLINLLAEFENHNIKSLLLKGAATLCDNYYGDPGARVMGDLDVLVNPEHIERCKAILITQGYIEVPDPGMTLEGLATDIRHHQIPAYRHPITHVIIEIHFNVSYGQAGRVIPTEQAWKNRIEVTLNGFNTSILSVQDRVLLNTAHALLPKREFLQGEISLLQLADFSTLVSQRSNEINWDDWANTAKLSHLETPFMTYLLMSHSLMNTTWPFEFPAPKVAHNSHQRILKRTRQKNITGTSRIKTLFKNRYYYFRLPAWVWNNVCYAPGLMNLPARIILLIRVIFRVRSWSKI